MDEILHIEDVSALTGVPVDSLRYYRQQGKGGPRSGRLGKRIVYRRSDVDAWIAAAFEDVTA